MKLPHRLAALLALTLCATVLTAAAPATLSVLESGKGSPAIVLVHDVGQGREIWEPLVQRLETDRRVVRPNLPGHGESEMIQPFALDDVADAIAALAAKQPGGSAVVVGHRGGGLLALRAAERHPKSVRALVVIDAAARPPATSDEQKQMMARMIDEKLPVVLGLMVSAAAKDSAERATLLANARKVAPGHLQPYLREMIYADASAEIAKLTMPVLFVGTDKSWSAGKEWATIAAERGYEGAPHATGRQFARAGYMVMAEQPDSLAAAIRGVTATK